MNIPGAIHDTHLKAIALVAIRSAQLDNLIELLLAYLIAPQFKTAEMLLKNWSQSRQIELMKTLMIDHFPQYTTEIDEFTAKVVTARSKRNQIIHYLWGQVDQTGAAQLASIRPFRQKEMRSMTAQAIHQVAVELSDRCTEMHTLIDWLGFKCSPWRDELARILRQSDSPWPLPLDQPKTAQESSPPQQPAQKSDPQE